MGHTKKLFINAVMEVPCSTWRAWTKVSTLKNRLNRQASSVHSKRIIWLHSRETFWPIDTEQTQTGGYNGKYAIVKEERKVCLPARMIRQECPTWEIMKLSCINLMEYFVI